MFNLYTTETKDGFMGLVSNKVTSTKPEHEIDNRRIVAGFAIISLLVLSVIANGSQYQTNLEQQRYATIASHTTVI